MSELPHHVEADAARLRQLLLNLLGNAVKFTAQGSIQLRLLTVADGKTLRFEIVDTGPGVQPMHLHRLFQDFEKLDAGTTKAEGSGLGLFLCNQFATLMGGQVGYMDNPAGGSVFWLNLPLVFNASALPSPTKPDSGLEGRFCLGQGNGPPKAVLPLHVLVVDDVSMNREITEAFLRAAGLEVTCVESGAEAIAKVALTDFDVVLMDVRMPIMDGLEATRRIRQLGGSRGQVPVVALTAQVFAEQVAKCREAGMNSHLAKPFDPNMLLAAVTQAAEVNSARRKP